ncbi:MAG TPA: TonB-dependent siderophore receptor [Terracidiphilus sp.]|nr:TonB-dependent siderophore receptor [Terracidiphilus sp.]
MHAAATTRIFGIHSVLRVNPLGAVLLIILMAVPVCVSAQNDTKQSASASKSQTSAQQSASSAEEQKLKGKSTTVVVRGKAEASYLPESLTLGTLGSEPLKNAPISASVITRGVLNDQVSRLLSDVVKNDASVQADYVPVGYYGDYAIRGFPIDLATGIEIDGMTVAGEQDVPLENKESVEILQGLAGLESGVASGGGVIDFVSLLPANIKSVDLATDQRGSTYGAADLGHLFGSRQQVGVRFDVAGERIMSYLNGADGWRGVGAGAADWKISPRAILKTRFEYQHKRERDGSGYQLLGGTVVPDVHRIYASTMLGLQPWVKPDIYDVYNSNLRLDYTLPHNWLVSIEGSLSHSLIDDNVIYAYGASLDPNNDYAVNCPNAPDALPYFFCPDGTYGIYDYRNPAELRIDAVGEAILRGQVRTGAITHEISAGGELFVRTVHMPGYYTTANLSSPDGVTQDGAVYWYIGSENIYQPLAPYAAPGSADSAESPLQQAGPRRLWQNSRQSSGIVQDRMHLPGRIELVAGGRVDDLRDHNFSLTATDPGTPPTLTDKLVWLPRYALTFSPIQNLTLYGNYGVMLSLGPESPWWVDNGTQFLAPFYTRQVEVGVKFQPRQRILVSGDIFHMRAPYIYPRVIQAPDSFCPASEFSAPGDQCFESDGRETHNGLELSAQGNAASWLRLTASAAVIHAVSTDSGTTAFNGKQVIDVPRLRAAVFADIAVHPIPGLHVMPGWTYSSRNEATRDDQVSVPAWNVLNLGASYTPGGEKGRVTFHLFADNITNNRYWSDTGANFGDTFLWLGAPTTVRLDAKYTF